MTKDQVNILGVPIEAGAGRRGALMGPAALRTAGITEELEGLGITVKDLGDAAPDDASDAPESVGRVHSLRSVAGWTRALARWSRELAERDEVPIYLGGDHSLSLGTLAGHAAHAASVERELFVLWLDAHADFNTFETTETGNLHGTPLAYACGLAGFDALLGQPLDPRVNPKNVCIFGLRSVDRWERDLVESHGIEVADMRAIDEHGILRLLKPFLTRIKDRNGLLHVSLDVDFIEPDIAPAVGTTVPGGATFREAHLVMELLHDSGLVTSLDVVELNPFLDERGRTARLMVDLVASLLGRRIIDRPTRSF